MPSHNGTCNCRLFFPKHNNLPDVVRWFINNKVFWAMFYLWKLPVSMSSSRGLQLEDHGMTSGTGNKAGTYLPTLFLNYLKTTVVFLLIHQKGFSDFSFHGNCGGRTYLWYQCLGDEARRIQVLEQSKIHISPDLCRTSPKMTLSLNCALKSTAWITPTSRALKVFWWDRGGKYKNYFYFSLFLKI